MPSASTTAVRSFDGTELAAHSFGSGAAPPLLLVNAIGPDLSAWRCVIEELEPVRRVLSWDLRGLHGSAEPRSDRIDAAAHAEDAIAVLDSAGVENFAVAAWSTGTRIALEIAARDPERVQGLVIVSGGFGRGFRGLFRSLEISSVFPFGAGIAKHFATALEGPFRSFVRRPEIAGVVRQSGIIGPTANIELLVEVLQSLADSDLRTLFTIYEEVVGDADPAVLHEVQTPTLLITGKRDRFATQAMVDYMLTRLPSAEKVVYEKASHFLPLEYPERLAADITAFFRSLATERPSAPRS